MLDEAQARTTTLVRQRRSHTRISLLNLGTIAAFVAWLAFACYALAYLVSH